MSTPLQLESPRSLGPTIVTGPHSVPPSTSTAGISNTPSSLCSLGGDAQDSICSRIWTTISSWFSWICSWLTCSSVQTRTVSPTTPVQTADSLTQRYRYKLENAVVSILEAGLRGENIPKTKLILVFQREGQDKQVFPGLEDLSIPKIYNPNANRCIRPIERRINWSNILGESPVDANTSVHIALITIRENEGGKEMRVERSVCRVTASGENLPITSQLSNVDKSEVPGVVERVLDKWVGSSDYPTISTWAPRAELPWDNAHSLPENQREHLFRWISA